MGETFSSLMNYKQNQTIFTDLAKQLASRDSLIPFVGAGMSRPIYPTWKKLLIDLAKNTRDANYPEMVKPLIDGHQYEAAASYLYKIYGRIEFEIFLNKVFSMDKIDNNFSPACCLLPELFEGPVVTTNFDRVLEEVYKFDRKDFINVCIPNQNYEEILNQAIYSRQHNLIKIHGDIGSRQSLILTAEQYNTIYGDEEKDTPYTSAIRKVFTNNLIFIGCGLEEDRTLETLARMTQGGGHCNYAILELPEYAKDLNNDRLSSDTRMLLQEKFNNRINKLGDCYIRCIWYPYNQYDSVYTLLNELLEKVNAAKRSHKTPSTIKLDSDNEYKKGKLYLSYIVNKEIIQMINQETKCFKRALELKTSINYDRYSVSMCKLFKRFGNSMADCFSKLHNDAVRVCIRIIHANKSNSPSIEDLTVQTISRSDNTQKYRTRSPQQPLKIEENTDYYRFCLGEWEYYGTSDLHKSKIRENHRYSSYFSNPIYYNSTLNVPIKCVYGDDEGNRILNVLGFISIDSLSYIKEWDEPDSCDLHMIQLCAEYLYVYLNYYYNSFNLPSYEKYIG